VLYAVAMIGIGMLSHTGNNVAMDSYGPISDNANGIGEMAWQNQEDENTMNARQIMADLDAPRMGVEPKKEEEAPEVLIAICPVWDPTMPPIGPAAITSFLRGNGVICRKGKGHRTVFSKSEWLKLDRAGWKNPDRRCGLSAFTSLIREVENAMVAYARELDRQVSLTQAVAASRKSAHLAESLYKDGLKDFIYVLDTQRSLFAAEDQLAVSSAEVTANLIRLYKALGGGWNPTFPVDGIDN